MANQLAALLKPPEGMVTQAAGKLAGRGYQLHVQESRALGETPLTLDEFVKQQGKK